MNDDIQAKSEEVEGDEVNDEEVDGQEREGMEGADGRRWDDGEDTGSDEDSSPPLSTCPQLAPVDAVSHLLKQHDRPLDDRLRCGLMCFTLDFRVSQDDIAREECHTIFFLI